MQEIISANAQLLNNNTLLTTNDMPALRLYGNENAHALLNSMIQKGRFARAFLLFGDYGLGKKRLAAYFASEIVKSGLPPHLENKPVYSYQHPDIIWVEGSGKTNTYSVETVRWICTDAYVAANDSIYKVYIFPDCDLMQPAAQNALLKVVEEPPGGSFFIFTALRRDAFLPTLISRCISVAAEPPARSECRKAVDEQLATASATADGDAEEQKNCESPGSEEIDVAVRRFGGNIGKTLDYLLKREQFIAISFCEKIISDLLIGDEYSMLSSFYQVELHGRQFCRKVLALLDEAVRDAVTFRVAAGMTSSVGCFYNESKMIGEQFSRKRLERLHTELGRAADYIERNGNISLAFTGLCASL